MVRQNKVGICGIIRETKFTIESQSNFTCDCKGWFYEIELLKAQYPGHKLQPEEATTELLTKFFS